MSSKDSSVCIVVLKQFYFPQCWLWNNLRFLILTVFSEAVVDTPNFFLHQSLSLSWNSFTFPSVVFETISGSLASQLFLKQHWCPPKDLHQSSLLSWNSFLLFPVLSLKQSRVPKPHCCFCSTLEKTCIRQNSQRSHVLSGHPSTTAAPHFRQRVSATSPRWVLASARLWHQRGIENDWVWCWPSGWPAVVMLWPEMCFWTEFEV